MSLRTDLWQYINNCAEYGDEPELEDLRRLLANNPEPVLCGHQQMLEHTVFYTDWSAPCKQPVNADGYHNGPHRDENGNIWPNQIAKRA